VTDGGTRLLIDIEGAGVDKKAPPALNKGNAIVGGVLLQEFASPGGKTTRMLVQLSSKAEYRVKADDKGLVLELERAETTRAMGSAPSPALGGAKQEAPAAKAPSASAATMSNVKFDHQAGYDRVVLELSAAAQHTELPFNDRLTIELRDVKLPDALQRKLDTKAFGGAVKTPHRHRPPRRGHPQRAAAARRGGQRQHRHLRRRVTGNVTIRMHNVPWDRALEVILAARSLGMQRDGNIIRIAPQSVLDKERELAIEREAERSSSSPSRPASSP
jgi:hypothetical protein